MIEMSVRESAAPIKNRMHGNELRIFVSVPKGGRSGGGRIALPARVGGEHSGTRLWRQLI
jgi:hypothetical protein